MSDLEKEFKQILKKMPRCLKFLLLDIIFYMFFMLSVSVGNNEMAFGFIVLTFIFIIWTIVFMYGDMINGS